MDIERDGAEHFGNALSSEELRLILQLADRYCDMGAGARITSDDTLSQILAPSGTMHRIATSRLGADARPVRAILFDKRSGMNWALGWHQDRTIAVRERSDAPSFGPWSKKSGLDHVEPPFEYIAGMLTLRAHLDACGPDNAPLKIVPGSHRLRRVPVDEIEAVVAEREAVSCLAGSGDVWAYGTGILHASDASLNPTHRRVLHVDYASASLPSGLNWFGI